MAVTGWYSAPSTLPFLKKHQFFRNDANKETHFLECGGTAVHSDYCSATSAEPTKSDAEANRHGSSACPTEATAPPRQQPAYVVDFFRIKKQRPGARAWSARQGVEGNAT